MSLNRPLTINKVKTIEESYVVHSYEYRINDIQLHKSANIQIIFKDENGNIVMFRDRKIQGLEYKNWGEDDAYIDDIVKREITAMQSGIVENITEKKFGQDNVLYDVLSSLRDKVNAPSKRSK